MYFLATLDQSSKHLGGSYFGDAHDGYSPIATRPGVS